MNRNAAIPIDAFLDGFTGAGLFGRLRHPGAPTEFVDSRTLAEMRETQRNQGQRRASYQPGAQPQVRA